MNRRCMITRSQTAAARPRKNGDGPRVKNMPKGCGDPQCGFDKVKAKNRSNAVENESSKLSEKFSTTMADFKSNVDQNKKSPSPSIKPFPGFNDETPVNTLKSVRRFGIMPIRKRLFSDKDDSKRIPRKRLFSDKDDSKQIPKRVKGAIMPSDTSSLTRNMARNMSRNSSAVNEKKIKHGLQRVFPNANLIGDFSAESVLPVVVGQHEDLKSISRETLARLIKGHYGGIVGHYTIVDCRFPYEYKGGHIKGAINISTTEQIREVLRKNSAATNSSYVTKFLAAGKRDILIFYCEFSLKRGPIWARRIRNMFQAENMKQYQKGKFPEIYLLHGGYITFYEVYKELCEPPGYITMTHPDYTEEFNRTLIELGLSPLHDKKKTTKRKNV